MIAPTPDGWVCPPAAAPCHATALPGDSRGTPGGTGRAGSSRDPAPSERGLTYRQVQLKRALSHQLPKHRSKARRAGKKQSPGVERKGKRKQGKSRKKRPVGARSRRQGLTLSPAALKPQLRRGANNAASVRGRHASAEAGGRRARPPHRTDRPLFPRTKGTTARGGAGGERMPGREELPYPGSPGHDDGSPWGWFPTWGWDGDVGDAMRDEGLDHSIHRVGGKVEHRTQSKCYQGNRQERNTRGLLCGSVTRQIWRVLLFKYNV